MQTSCHAHLAQLVIIVQTLNLQLSLYVQLLPFILSLGALNAHPAQQEKYVVHQLSEQVAQQVQAANKVLVFARFRWQELLQLTLI